MLDRLLARWQLKLLAAVMALFLWVIMTGETRILREVSVPLDFMIEDAKILTGDPPRRVTVGLRGSESLIRGLDPVSILCSVDVRQASTGPRSVLLANENLRGLPRGVEIRWIDPDRIRFSVERRMRRVLPVEAQLVGVLPDGFSVYGQEVLPDSVAVEGPESEVRGMTSVMTEPIPLETHTQPFSARVSALPASDDVRLIDPRPMDVRVDVDQTPIQRVFQVAPSVRLAEGFSATPDPDQVLVAVSGPPRLVAPLVIHQVRAIADATLLEPQKTPYRVPLRVELAELAPRDQQRITVHSINPDQLAVTIVTEENP